MPHVNAPRTSAKTPSSAQATQTEGANPKDALRGMPLAAQVAQLAPAPPGAAGAAATTRAQGDPFAKGPIQSTKTTSKKDVSIGDAKATMSRGVLMNEQTADGYTQTRAGGTVGYDGGVTAMGSASQVVGDSSAKRERAVEGGLDKDGPRLGVKQTDTLMAGSKNQQSTTNGLEYAGGNVSMGQDRSAKWQEEDGTKRQQSSNIQVGAGKDGLTFGAGKSDVTTRADGTKTTDSANIGGNILKGEINGSMGTKTVKDGKVESAASVTGGAKIDKNGNLLKANLNASVERKGTSVSGGISYDVTAQGPFVMGGGFVVVWTKRMQGSGSVGMSGGPVGGKVGGEMHKTKTGRAVFATEAEALAFKDNIGSELAKMQTDVPDDVAAVERMKPGEEITAERGRSMNAQANAKVAGATVAVGGSSGSASQKTVRKISATVVEVEVERSEFDQIGASIGLGATLGTSSKDTSSNAVILRFDLATPAGKTSFEQYQAGKPLTEKAGILSITTVARKGHEDKSGLTAPKVGIGTTSSTAEAIAVGSDGSRKGTFEGTHTKSRTLAVPLVGGKQNVSTGITERSDKDKAVSYDVKTTVDDSRGKDAREDLAAATGTQFVSGDAKRSGTWEVSSEFSPRDIDELTARMTSASGDMSALIAKTSHGHALAAALSAAKGTEDRMRAISKFVANAGPRGLQVIRDNIGRYRGGKSQSFDLKLAGDPWFPGPEARRELEARLGQYKGAARAPDANLGATLSGVARDQAWAEGRLRALEDPKRYTDLPSGLRELEIKRTAGWARALADTQQQLFAALAAERAKGAGGASKADASAPAGKAAEAATAKADTKATKGGRGRKDPAAKGKETATEGKADPKAQAEGQAAASLDQRVAELEERVAIADASLRSINGEVRVAKAAVAKSRWVHFRNPFGTGRPAAQRIGDGASQSFYEMARRHWPYADGQMARSATHADAAAATRALAYQQPSAAARLAQLQVALANIERAIALAGNALRSYRVQEQGFQDVVKRYPSRYEELFGGYGATMPAGEVT